MNGFDLFVIADALFRALAKLTWRGFMLCAVIGALTILNTVLGVTFR